MNQFKQKIINWFFKKLKEQIRQEVIEEFDSNDGNLILDELLARENKRDLRRMLFKNAFPLDFKDMDERRRYEVYFRMNRATSIMDLFKSRYTRAYEAFTQAKDDDEREQLRGRINELQNLIDQAGSAEEIIIDWENSQRLIKSKRNRIFKYLTKKL